MSEILSSATDSYEERFPERVDILRRFSDAIRSDDPEAVDIAVEEARFGLEPELREWNDFNNQDFAHAFERLEQCRRPLGNTLANVFAGMEVSPGILNAFGRQVLGGDAANRPTLHGAALTHAITRPNLSFRFPPAVYPRV